MLKDIERKILRIIGNYEVRHRRTPTIHEIEIKTGRNRAKVLAVLSVLAKERYIEWGTNDPECIVLLEAWERKSGNNVTWMTYQ